MARDDHNSRLLQYWLRCIQYEEALQVRPRAMRSNGLSSAQINLREPTEGRLYFKLELGDVAALLANKTQCVSRPLVGEVGEFFESWLTKQYRRFHSEVGELEMMVACPVVHLPTDELTGLFRFSVGLTFCYANGEPFVVPKPRQRKTGKLPPPPDLVKISLLDFDERQPFFLDGRLLSRQLGMVESEVDAVFEACRAFDADGESPTAFLNRLCRSLIGVALADEQSQDPNWLLLRLYEETKRRLGGSANSGAQAYALAIAFDASRVKTTIHLQREMRELIAAQTPAERNILDAYLRGCALPSSRAECLGLFGKTGLTPSQQRAVSRFLGSPLSAVQGPPGTGKTTLIHHLAAHEVVARAVALAESGELPHCTMVICSTNNRAVDNAIDPLCEELPLDALPIAIRAGSRQVCEKVLVKQLARSLGWLRQRCGTRTVAQRDTDLKAALDDFRAAYQALMQHLRPRLIAHKAAADKHRQEQELLGLRRDLAKVQNLEDGSHAAAATALPVLCRLEKTLAVLSNHTEGKATRKKVKRVKAYFDESVARVLEKGKDACSRIGTSLAIALPPDADGLQIEAILAAWEDAAEDGLDQLLPLIADLERRQMVHKKLERAKILETSIAQAVVPAVDECDDEMISQLKHIAFDKAVAVREAHVVDHAQMFESALKEALAAVEDQSSLRNFARAHAVAHKRLAQLFPIWGCTLLSMGNVFGDAPETIDKVVIDEAGQCHPAFAISALMRSRSALIIGDVHQLTPIFGLARQEEARIAQEFSSSKRPLPEIFRVYDEANTSVQALGELGDGGRLQLTDHYRCQPEIISISDVLCGYDLRIHTPKRSRAAQVDFLDYPVLFVPVVGTQERQGGSWHNPQELAVVLAILERLLEGGVAPAEVAVITPYRAQLYALRKAMLARRLPIEPSVEMIEFEREYHSSQTGIALGTVHRFQGGERSVVLFTSVVTDPKSLPFINDRVNLLNVAVSRAKEHFITVGCEGVLVRGPRTRHLVERARPLVIDQ